MIPGSGNDGVRLVLADKTDLAVFERSWYTSCRHDTQRVQLVTMERTGIAGNPPPLWVDAIYCDFMVRSHRLERDCSRVNGR